jgi:hypothetical protein
MRSPSGWISSNGIGHAGIPETSDPFRKEDSSKAKIISTFMFVCFYFRRWWNYVAREYFALAFFNLSVYIRTGCLECFCELLDTW